MNGTKLKEREEFIVVPRREYEDFLQFKFRSAKAIKLNSTQRKSLIRARKNLERGKFLTLNELKQKLGITN